MTKNKILYIYLDESGAMHLKNENYFVIAGFFSFNKVNEKSIQKKFEKKIKKKYPNLNKLDEIKAKSISYEERTEYIKKIIKKI